jgi:hypothetical protein
LLDLLKNRPIELWQPIKVRELTHDSRLRFRGLNHGQTDAFSAQNRTIGISEIAPEPDMLRTWQDRR